MTGRPLVLALALAAGCSTNPNPAATAPASAVAKETMANNRATIERFVSEFKNKGNHDIVDELMTESFTHHLPDPRLPPGRQGAKLLGQSVAGAFPDVHVTINDMIVAEDKVVERTTATGTHKGEFAGVPASGNSVTWTETHVYRLEGGKIAEWWPQVDMMAIMMQIGALPPPA